MGELGRVSVRGHIGASRADSVVPSGQLAKGQ